MRLKTVAFKVALSLAFGLAAAFPRPASAGANSAGNVTRHGHTSNQDGGRLTSTLHYEFKADTVTAVMALQAAAGSTTSIAGFFSVSGGTDTYMVAGGTLAVRRDGSVKLGATAAPASPADGTFWYDRAAAAFQFQSNGTTLELDPAYVVYHYIEKNGVGANAAAFFPITGNFINMGTASMSNSTEGPVSLPAGVVGTAVRLSCGCTAGSICAGGSGTITFQLRKNTANASLSCSLSGSAALPASCQGTGAVALTGSDKISISYSAPNTTCYCSTGLMDCTLVIKPGAN